MKWMSWLAACLAASVTGTLPLSAQAEEETQETSSSISEFRGGVLAHDQGPFGSNKEEGLDLNGEFLFHSPKLLKWIGRPRPHVGASFAPNSGSTSHAYIGLTWQQDFLSDWFAYVSLGGAVHDGDDLLEVDPETLERNESKALGCRLLFRESLGAGYRITPRVNVSLHLEHISNARLCENNEGIDNTGFRFGWVF